MVPCCLSDEELEWLRRLARGDRIGDIAIESGLSRRSLYRRLDDLWAKLGVVNRAQGIAMASRKGWIP